MSAAPEQLEQLLRQHFAARAAPARERSVALEAYAAGELDPDARAVVEAHLAECDDCKLVLNVYDEVAELWTESSPEPGLLARLLAWLRRPRIWIPASALAAAALLLLVLPRQDAPVALHSKGSFALHVAVERRGHAFRLQDGTRLETGDHLGFFYSAERDGHLSVLYLDEAGEQVRLFPALSITSAEIQAGSEVRLPDGALISDGEGCEWVIGIFSRAPLPSDAAQHLARQMYRQRRGCKLGRIAAQDVEVSVFEVQR